MCNLFSSVFLCSQIFIPTVLQRIVLLQSATTSISYKTSPTIKTSC